MSYQKPKEERLKDIHSAIINAGMERMTTSIVLEYFDDKYKKDFEETSDRVLEILALILGETQQATDRFTIFINKVVSMALKEHKILGNWSQLGQIQESLPDQIISAIKDEQPKIKELIGRSAELEKAFNELSLEEKEKLMEKKP
jgi:hypothetical protein